MNRIGDLRSFARDFVDEWRADRVPDLAAQVAFYAVLSLFPALLAFTAALSVLDSVVGADVARRTEANVIDFLTSVLTDEASSTIDAIVELFADDRTGLLTVSLLAAVWTLTRAFAALVRALDVVYDLDEHRSWLATRLTAIVLALGSVVAGSVMVAGIVVGPLLGTGQELAGDLGLGEGFGTMWNLLRIPAAFGLLVLYAATIFHIAPDHSTPWRADVPGAVITALAWVVFSGGLRLYVVTASAGNAVYGALGGVLVVLIWFWLLALAVMVGGQVNATLWQGRAGARPAPSAGVAMRGPVAAERRHAPEVRTQSEPPESAGVEGGAQAGDELAGVDGAPSVEEQSHEGRADGDTVGGC